VSSRPSDKLPSLTSQIPRDLRLFTDRLREVIDNIGSSAGDTTVVQSTGGGTSGGGGEDPTVEAPTTPIGFVVTPGFGIFYLEWDYPAYAGHAYTEIYVASTDTFGEKVLLGIATGTTFVHEVGNNETRCYWIRHVNANGVASAFNDTAGSCGTTTIDPAEIIPLLEDQLDESHLTAALNTRLDGIDDSLSPTSIISRLTDAEGDVLDNATDITALEATVNDPLTGVDATSVAVSALDGRVTATEGGISAIAEDVTALETTVNDETTGVAATAGAVSQLQTDVSTLDGEVSANASAVTALEASTTDAALFATLEEQGMVYVDNSGAAGARYTIKLRASDADGGAQVGFGLAAIKENNKWVSDVRFSADRFAIMSPAAYTAEGTLSSAHYPFIVQSSNRTVDGEYFPAGVYMKAAFIDAATITTAKIANAAITDAKISTLSANKITAGDIAVGRFIQSASYGAGQVGWRIDGDGEAIFGNKTGSRLQWDGSRVSIYDADNTLVLSSGDSLNAGAAANLLLAARFNKSGWTFESSYTSYLEPRIILSYGSHPFWESRGNILWRNSLSGLAEPFDNATGSIGGKLSNATYSTSVAGRLYQDIPVVAGKRYAGYCYTGAVGCIATIYVQWYTTSYSYLGWSGYFAGENDSEKTGGPSLDSYKLLGGFLTAPANAAFARFNLSIRGNGTYRTSPPWTAFVRPFFGAVPADRQTLPPWTDYVENVFITDANISTYIRNAAIDTAQIKDAAIENAKIANAAVEEAKIATAAITNSKIGTAAVDTIKVAGGTVTSMNVDIDAWSIDLSTTYQNGPLAGAALASGASGVVILCTMTLGGNTAARQGYMRVTRTSDSVVIGEGSILSQANDGPAATYAFFDASPPAGYITYRMQVRASATGISSGYRSIIVVGGRR
jgi:hypothetical protein